MPNSDCLCYNVDNLKPYNEKFFRKAFGGDGAAKRGFVHGELFLYTGQMAESPLF